MTDIINDHSLMIVPSTWVLAPSLFSLMFSAMLADAFRHGDVEISLKYRWQTAQNRKLQAKTNIMIDIIKDFLFGDDCALNMGSEADLTNSSPPAPPLASLSAQKKEVLHQPAAEKPYVEPHIKSKA